MIELLLLAHWLVTFFILLMWCAEWFAQRWTGYRFVYRLYVGLPLLVYFTILLQVNAPLPPVPEIMASLTVVNAVPAIVTGHLSILQWVWFVGAAIALGGLLLQWQLLTRLSGKRIALGASEALIVKEVTSPCLKGIIRPVILLPENFREKFNTNQLELIIAHEKVHARRMDNLWNVVALGLRAIFWFNPIIWLGYHRFRLVQELSCDETVLAGQPGHVPFAYAKTLLAASAFPQSNQPLCTQYGDKKMLMKRMSCIKSAGLISKGAQRLVLCVIVAISGSLGAIAATEAASDHTDLERKMTVQPKYPKAAFEAQAEAEVLLEFNIGANDGRPFDIHVIENTAQEAYREDFEKAAITSLQQWQYEPSGKVHYNVRTKIGFKLGK